MEEHENEEKTQELQPFIMDDIQEQNLCQNCELIDNCAILHRVNQMSMRRDGRKADEYFGCTPFYTEIQV